MVMSIFSVWLTFITVTYVCRCSHEKDDKVVRVGNTDFDWRSVHYEEKPTAAAVKHHVNLIKSKFSRETIFFDGNLRHIKYDWQWCKKTQSN